ncbi:SGNH/GDSL hydrolase family protein [uncultured Rhodoblastus sp.]|uniref:SGNH/GDSL hydrolase family protein n=1 Tax=uncultured Rhodoblastus sp. TaxID=543037 RepID=UPI0025DEEA33|nr:SGNH/GDSL hydrolase family protein [uncultured Rhodoblastus sp.]
MRKWFFLVPFASLAAFMAFPAVVPGGIHGNQRAQQAASESSCGVADAMPAGIAALPRLSRAIENHRRLRIATIGSSSTEGVGASSPAANYPSQLRAMLQLALPEQDFEVINLGVGGETAGRTVERLRREMPKLAPDLVVWQVGTNDALTGAVIADYQSILRDALQYLKAGQFDVLMIGPQWTRKLAGNPAFDAVREATAQVARSEGVTLVSRYDAMRKLAEATGREDLTGPDHLHMNDRGYRCMAEQVAVTMAHAVDSEESGRLGPPQPELRPRLEEHARAGRGARPQPQPRSR